MRRLRGFLTNVSVVCSFVCIIVKTLDWYNPYMDFSGRAFFVQLLLYVSVLLLAFIRKKE